MAGTSTLMALKANSEARSAEDRIVADRNRAILILCVSHLTEYGYVEAAAALEREGGAPLTRFEAADNVDLLTILKEYEEYYELKLGKKPKLVRKVDNDSVKETKTVRRRPVNRNSAATTGEKAAKADGLTQAQTEKYMLAASNAGVTSQQLRGMENKLGATPSQTATVSNASLPPPHGGGISVDGGGGSGGGGQSGGFDGLSGSAMKVGDRNEKQRPPPAESIEDRLLKPLPFAGDPDLRALAQTITRDIFQSNPGVTWDDVVSLKEAKRLLKEAVVMPVKYPFLFTGLLSPWQGILLYGPPGTGKTMLAKAVATECHTTFFNISASSIVSKYRGDSEKLVRVLFELARYHAPSTIFLDEIDAIMGQRGGFDGGSEHEGSRRMKTELLIQMDGLAKGKELVFVLAASNIPWELDMALLRRLEKRVMVGLPDQEARTCMLEKLLIGTTHDNTTRKKALHPLSEEVNLKEVGARTEGFSGSDIRLLCKEVAMKPVRRMMLVLEEMELDPKRQGRVATEEEVANVRANDPITLDDMEQALRTTNPASNTKYTQKYKEWEKGFGAV